MAKTESTLDYTKWFQAESDTKGNASPFVLLSRLFRNHNRKLALSALYYMLKTSPVWVLPVVTANIINIVSYPNRHSMQEFWINFAVIFIVIVQNIPTHTMHIKYISQAARHVEAGLRSTLVRKLQQLSLGYHGDMNAGRLQSKVLRDVEAIDFLSRQMMMTVIPAGINLAVVVGLTLYHSWMVALFFALMAPTSIYLVRLFRSRMSQRNREVRRNIEEMSGKVSETVEMIPVTRAHGLEEVEIRKVDAALENIRQRGHMLDVLEAYFGSSSWVVFQLFQVGCLFFTAYLAHLGYMEIGDIVMYQGFFNMIIGSVTSILNVYPNLVKGMESLHSVSEVLLSDETEEYKGRTKLDGIHGAYSFRGVGFRYSESERHVLKDFSLDIRAGETIAFVGESGSGKSTILNLIIGFYKPQSGIIKVDGLPMDELSMRQYRQSLAIVLQNNILFSGTIRENITYGLPNISDEQVQQAVYMANLQDVIDSLPQGLETSVGEHGGKLSGGQRQRIAIARALVRDPKIIILDEATSALDNVSERHVQSAIERLMHGRTTFIVAHRLSTIKNADRIVVMKQGKIVEVGSYDELLEMRGEFYKLKNM
ncbi:ABC transporter ATP-binding protein [Paenibacillus sp. HN-1]|uniref:ABC transporter ATP-binding protein n=1 Tax=Paenibacillus TaxID=44249 RepID=UPI001CA87C12|nr:MULTISPECIES: ABC transporter ATP-binding protein [Paenibacillus]MBY9079457.1 ABC transporter ATP-binding protein [Paenibacillus sp. CGMCC 1.18879]MBY9083438.1 ABC transporter ATP-binding protein [Paenibacillus sinensis]